MQQIQVIGNLGDDAQLVDLGSNKQVINFTIAHTEKLSNGEKKTTWFKCAYFTSNAGVLPYLKKGSKVYIRGKIDIEIYTASDGSTKVNLKAIVSEIELCYTPASTNDNTTKQPTNTPKQANNKQEEDPDDLPF